MAPSQMEEQRKAGGRWESPQAGKIQNLGRPGSLNIFYVIIFF